MRTRFSVSALAMLLVVHCVGPTVADESFRVASQRALDAVNTVVYSNVGDPAQGEQAKVEWHVTRRDGYRIIDMRIAGASLAKVMHDEFGSYLQRNNGDLPNLIRLLQAKLSAEKPG